MFYENQLGIKKSVVSLFMCFCPNIGTKFREPYHSNHVIPHQDDIENYYLSFAISFIFDISCYITTFSERHSVFFVVPH